MQKINTLVGVLCSQCDDKKKLKVLLRFYNKNPELAKVRIFWGKNQYEKSLFYSISFLKKNQDELRLKYIQIHTNSEFAVLIGEKALNSNCATIKTIGQLVDIQKVKMFPSNKKLLLNLIKIYSSYKIPLLCVNAPVSDKEKCRAIIHEINAWLLSGCLLPPISLKAFFYEWRASIFSVPLLKRMDKLFFFEI